MTWLWVAIAVALIAIWVWRQRRRKPQMPGPGPVSNWFKIRWTDERIFLDVRTEQPWQAEIPWANIERVCLKMEPDAALGVSNGLYVWVAGRPNSYAIPLDGEGGWELTQEMTRRGKLPPDLTIRAMGSVSGVFCWPPESEKQT